jgi:nucleoside-diphosphate-sugar epimerase
VVDETTRPAPAAARGSARLAAETEVLTAAAARGVDAVSLRIVGIYGPGRGVHARLAAGSYRVVGDGAALVCRIHVDDLVAAIVAVGDAETVPSRIYNVADDAPTPSADHADRVAAMLGLPPPPRVPASQVSAEVLAMLAADRRVDNRRLKRELGWAPRYPDAVAGVAAALAEERGG